MTLARKIKRRKGIRASISALITDIEPLLSNFSLTNQVRVVGLRNNLLELSSGLKEINKEICALIDVNNIENDVIESLNFMKPLHKILAEISAKTESIKSTVASSESSHVSENKHSLRLPKLELRAFSGNPLEWQSFWDQFKASFHNNESINDVERFLYLRKFLSGSALSTISGLTLSDGNYNEAVNLLNSRYGNEQVQINAHMESLIKLEKIKPINNVKQIRKLYNDVENTVRNLKTLKYDSDKLGLLIPILNDRLPEELRMIISRRFGNNIWTVDLMLEYLNEELQVKERCALMNEATQEKEKKRFTAEVLFTQNEQSERKCVYCLNTGHPPSRCDKVTNTQSRVAILRKYANMLTIRTFK